MNLWILFASAVISSFIGIRVSRWLEDRGF